MTTLLLVFLYFIYIGLGVPDSAFGAALPAMRVELGFSVSLAGVVTTLISLGTVAASFFSARIINKLSTGLTVALSTALTAAAVLAFSFANGFLALCFCALPLGLGAGAIDAAMNNYVATRYKPTHMNFLHCFYGVGVVTSPLVFSLTLNGAEGWRKGYLILFVVQAIITALSFAVLPLWKKVKSANEEEFDAEPLLLKYKDMFKVKAVRAVWVAFFTTCALEFTCDTWGTSYLVDKGLSEAAAARYITYYYVGITAGRFLAGVLAAKLSSGKILVIGYSVIAVAVTVLFLPVPVEIKGYALFFIGLGNGPAFPNLTYVLPKDFGARASQSLVSAQMVASNLGILLVPPLFGVIAGKTGVKIFPLALAIMFVLMIISTAVYFRLPKKPFESEKQ